MIPPETSIGKVRLRVADIDDLTTFYERVIGLHAIERDNGTVRLGPEGGEPLIELVAAPTAPAPPSFSTGLFHLAILVPDRAELARALQRVIGAGWRLTGASDHLVSEALYTRDPEGNGIEIYRDRPRDQWSEDRGELRMATLPLDLDDVLGELDDPGRPPEGGMPAATTMGHVHLQVADIPAAEGFYNGGIGLDVMVRSYPGALFLAAGGYHHHLGLNTWQSQGAPAPPEGALGLDRYELVFPDAGSRDAAAAAVADSGDPLELSEGVLATDPSGNRVLLTTSA